MKKTLKTITSIALLAMASASWASNINNQHELSFFKTNNKMHIPSVTLNGVTSQIPNNQSYPGKLLSKKFDPSISAGSYKILPTMLVRTHGDTADGNINFSILSSAEKTPGTNYVVLLSTSYGTCGLNNFLHSPATPCQQLGTGPYYYSIQAISPPS